MSRSFLPHTSLIYAVRLLLFLNFFVYLGNASTLGNNWWQFRGPQGDGHSESTNLPLQWSEQKNISWKTAIHDRGWSSPVIWGKQIWITTATVDGSKLFGVCLDKDTGKIVY
ncbi:MAG: hypothetical protein VYC62_09630, partial [Verrucomicrobiota bacterium]|nr:hypothetical protein [Verrucomicrobiota bacterium]